MSGLTPYVDFTDSKGPLLWLIYGLGYLISPHTFHGVFLFQVLFYWLDFYMLYKIANLLLRNEAQSIIASMLMGLFYFYPGMHQEMLSEDYCHLFNSVVLYATLKTIYDMSPAAKYLFWCGVSCGATLLIKYCYCLSLLVPVSLILFFMWRNKINIMSFLGYFMFGGLIIVAPFIIYFVLTGALYDFINEYFINTGQTIGVITAELAEQTDGRLSQKWPYVIWYVFRRFNYFGEYMRFILLFFLLSLYVIRQSKCAGIVLILWFCSYIILGSFIMGERYFMPISIFAMPGICFLVKFFKYENLPNLIISGSIIILIVVMSSNLFFASEFHYPIRDRIANINLRNMGALINERERQLGRKPTLAYMETFDRGEHILTNAVAGTKYYSIQYGMTKEMLLEYESEIFKVNPDFIITGLEQKEARAKLEAKGYECVLIFDPWPALDGSRGFERCLYIKY